LSADLLRREQVGQDLVAVVEADRPAPVEARVALEPIEGREGDGVDVVSSMASLSATRAASTFTIASVCVRPISATRS
jgi:hypothetical protein